MKKSLIYIIIFTLLIQLTACRTMQEINKEEATAATYPKKDIEVYTSKNKYAFEEGHYIIANDTLIGDGLKYEKLISTPFSGSIAIRDIDKIKTSQFDPAATILLGGAIALVVVSISSIKLFNGSPLGEGKF